MVQQIEASLQLPVKQHTKCNYGKIASAVITPGGRFNTEISFIVRSRFGEVYSCCCLPALPGPAWVLLKYVCAE